MAKNVLCLFIKIALLAAIMLMVFKLVPYDGLVSFITGLFVFQNAERSTTFILGEPAPEVWESLRDYFGMLINTLVSIPILSAVVSTYNAVICKIRPADVPKDCATSTLRRFKKIFTFIFLFWAFLRFLPYQSFFSDGKTYTASVVTVVMVFNLSLTIACYWFITKTITMKRSL